MSENDIKLVTSVPSNLANGQPSKKSVPERIAPKIAPEKVKSEADNVKAATMTELNANHADFKKAVVEINKALEKIPACVPAAATPMKSRLHAERPDKANVVADELFDTVQTPIFGVFERYPTYGIRLVYFW